MYISYRYRPIRQKIISVFYRYRPIRKKLIGRPLSVSKFLVFSYTFKIVTQKSRSFFKDSTLLHIIFQWLVLINPTARFTMLTGVFQLLPLPILTQCSLQMFWKLNVREQVSYKFWNSSPKIIGPVYLVFKKMLCLCVFIDVYFI